MQAGAFYDQKLLNEYTALASTYDQRWSAYLDASLQMTLDVVAELPAKRILDVACGTGQLLEMLANRPGDPALFGIDRVPAMLNVARQRNGPGATFAEADAAKIPFEGAGFQLITSTNALHYFPDINAALREFRRVVSPSGNLVITDWCRDFLWMKLLNRALPWTHHAHVRTFSIGELEQSLAVAGFKLVHKARKKIDWFWGLMVVHAIPVPTEDSSTLISQVL